MNTRALTLGFGLGLLAIACVSCGKKSECAKRANYAKSDFKGSLDCANIIEDFNTEEYDHIPENEFKNAKQNPLSTFSIDVDTASYSNVRRFVNEEHRLPPVDAVRAEELINYFSYNYPKPTGEVPFTVTTEMAACPWNSNNRLLHIGLQGKPLDESIISPCNLVFLIDTSGSMSDSNKLPLLKASLGLLLKGLSSGDKVSIVAYAGSAGLVLPPTPADKRKVILKAIKSLESGGSTAGGAGIELAYKVAKENLIADGNNRVILATDGDFNVGTSSTSELVRLISEMCKDDVFLTICGFGMGNYKDGRMEQISNAGNGNYFYIDGIKEAEKVFVKELRANMFVIAKDVKIQVEFNPAKVSSYRLIGYENRKLANEDFEDDLKDAGELGAGHTVTALYEIVMAGSADGARVHSDLKYQQTSITPAASENGEVATIKLRYKLPKGTTSQLISTTVQDKELSVANASDDFRFSAAVAGFAMILRQSKFVNGMTLQAVESLAKSAKGTDETGYRGEFLDLVHRCSLLKD